MTAKVDDSIHLEFVSGMTLESLAETCNKAVADGLGATPVVLAFAIDKELGLSTTMCIAAGGIRNIETGKEIAFVLTSNPVVAASMADKKNV